MGKFYVMTACGMVVQHDTQEDAQESVQNGLGGDYGFLADRIVDHYPTQEEFEAYMAEAKTHEEAYYESCKEQREAHAPRKPVDEHNQVALPDEHRMGCAEVEEVIE